MYIKRFLTFAMSWSFYTQNEFCAPYLFIFTVDVKLFRDPSLRYGKFYLKSACQNNKYNTNLVEIIGFQRNFLSVSTS